MNFTKYLSFTLIIIFSLISFLTSAQNSFIPQNLGAKVNSSYGEINPILSPDGKKLFFVRINHPENFYGEIDSQDIWVSFLEQDGSWSEAKHLSPQLNRLRYNSVLGITADGKSILINGYFTKKDKWKKRGVTIYSLSDTTWSAPQPFKIKRYGRINKGKSSNVFYSETSNVMLISATKRFNGKKNNLYVSKKLDPYKFSKPKKLKKPISIKKYSEETPFLSSDGKTLYFSSNRQKDKTDFNIYKSTRQDDSYRIWSEPVMITDTINSAEFESYFKTNLKGSTAFFCSEKNSLGDLDIFKVKLFEENPYVLISGNIVKNSDKSPLTGKSSYKILSESKVIDSIIVDPQSASYHVLLPFGKKYTLKANVPNYTGIDEFIDLTAIREYSEMHKDLSVESVPFVSVNGQGLIQGTNMPVGKLFFPILWIDGKVADTINVDEKGNYSFKVPFGKAYTLKLEAKGFQSIPDVLDLTAVNEYKEIKKDLLVAEISDVLVLVRGKVFNKKTLTPVDKEVHFSIHVDGVNVPAEVNFDSAWYQIRLEPGKKYSIHANASHFYPSTEEIDLSAVTAKTKITRNLTIAPIEIGETVKLNNIFFATGKAILKKESFPELDKLVKLLQDHPGLKIEIAGHTDNVGSADVNKKLSGDRAAAVEHYLESKGIDKDRIISNGYGMDNPVASNKTAEGRAKNRRVEFMILDK